MLNIFKNEKKSEKTEKNSNASSNVSTTVTNGRTITSITQNKTECYTTQTSHTSTTQILQKPALLHSRSSGDNRISYLDKVTFKAAPPRSAFTSTPLTIKPLSFGIKESVDAKPLVPAPQRVPFTTPIANKQNQLLNCNAESSSSSANELRTELQITVNKSTQFYDDQKSKVPVYKTRRKNRGKLLLINNIKFVNEKEIRKGAKLDESNTCELFNQMGFDIVKYRDLNKKDLIAKVSAFRKDKTLSKVDIGAVIVMSHGTGRERSDSTEIACTDGERLATTWIINEFDNAQCPQLNGKPKIFIFQCCRGDNWDIHYDGLPATVSRTLSDMLIAYATVPGFVAHRDPVHGTWYIQAICKVFMEHAHDTDVESLLKIVDSKLSSLVSGHGSKQTSSFENRGFKTCYLHPKLYEK